MYEKREMYYRIYIWAFLIISLLVSPLIVDAGQISTPDEQTVAGTAKEKLRTRVSHSCKDSPIEKVLMDLADQANIDIIKSPSVTGNITVKITDKPSDVDTESDKSMDLTPIIVLIVILLVILMVLFFLLFRGKKAQGVYVGKPPADDEHLLQAKAWNNKTDPYMLPFGIPIRADQAYYCVN